MYAAAMPALSVGVNQPLKIPPRMVPSSSIGPITRTSARRASAPSNGRLVATSGCNRTQMNM
jgi:hypothetical protein